MRTVPRLRPAALAATLLALLLSLFATACGSSDEPTKAAAASATPGGQAKVACQGGKVRFGVEPYEDPAKLTPAYKAVAAGLERKLGCPVELSIVEDYSAEVLAMENDKLDVAEFGPLGYVFAQKRANAEAVVSFADAQGQLTTYTGGIWVPKDSPIKDLKGLKGKSLALAEPGSTSGDALPRYALVQAGFEPKKDVKLDYAGGHPEALLALTKGKVDAAEINSQTLATATGEGTFDTAKYRQIWKSEPIPNDPITVRGNLDQPFKDAVKEALIGLDKETVGKVGKFLGVDPPGPLVEVQETTYAPLFDLAEKLGLTEKDV